MDYFTADPHFCHTNIIKYCKRPFGSVEEMDETILFNINDSVGTDDRLFILGDFAWGTRVQHYLDLINCKNIWFIMGNHDRARTKKPTYLESFEFYQKFSFMKVMGYYEEEFIIPKQNGKQMITMSHYPMSSWNKSHRGSYMLFGHVHGNKNKEYENKYGLDVGVDNHNFKPLSLDEVDWIMKSKSVELPVFS